MTKMLFKLISRCGIGLPGILCVAVVCIFSACKLSSDDPRPVIAVSVEPQRNILENIAGDDFRIVTVMPQGDNPETFEPSPSRRIDIEKSDIYFISGRLPFEEALLAGSADKDKYVDVSQGIELIYGTHIHQHSDGTSVHTHRHRTADPHIWASVRNARIIARTMAAKLIEYNPEKAEKYTSNLNAYLSRLDSLDGVFSAKLASAPNRSFLVWHPSLSYFSRDYGLEQIPVSSETKEMSVMSIANVIEKAKSDSVKVMLYQREYDSRQADMISKSIGARVVTYSPEAYNWEAELSSIVDELAAE